MFPTIFFTENFLLPKQVLTDCNENEQKQQRPCLAITNTASTQKVKVNTLINKRQEYMENLDRQANIDVQSN